jgi:hypothetical protein
LLATKRVISSDSCLMSTPAPKKSQSSQFDLERTGAQPLKLRARASNPTQTEGLAVSGTDWRASTNGSWSESNGRQFLTPPRTWMDYKRVYGACQSYKQKPRPGEDGAFITSEAHGGGRSHQCRPECCPCRRVAGRPRHPA